MTTFDARLLRLNGKTNTKIDQIVALMVKDKNRSEFETHLVDKVLRPYCLMVNRAENDNIPTQDAVDGTVSVVAAMLTEYIVRTIPRDNPPLLSAFIQSLLDDVTDCLLAAVSQNFDVEIQRGAPTHAAPPAAQ